MQVEEQKEVLNAVWEIEKVLCDYYAIDKVKAGNAIESIIRIKEFILNECKNQND